MVVVGRDRAGGVVVHFGGKSTLGVASLHLEEKTEEEEGGEMKPPTPVVCLLNETGTRLICIMVF